MIGCHSDYRGASGAGEPDSQWKPGAGSVSSHKTDLSFWKPQEGKANWMCRLRRWGPAMNLIVTHDYVPTSPTTHPTTTFFSFFFENFAFINFCPPPPLPPQHRSYSVEFRLFVRFSKQHLRELFFFFFLDLFSSGQCCEGEWSWRERTDEVQRHRKAFDFYRNFLLESDYMLEEETVLKSIRKPHLEKKRKKKRYEGGNCSALNCYSRYVARISKLWRCSKKSQKGF